MTILHTVLHTALYIAGIAFAFGMVIFFHEFGHFMVAKKSGVKVERFSFGLGPEMIGFKWGETRYCIAWLPLGGEVRMAGELIEEDPDAQPETTEPVAPAEFIEDTSRHFFSQPWHRRVLIALAGPAMNYVLAALIFFGMLLIWGESIQTNKTQVGLVVAGMPADKAGIQSGDRIVSIQGQPVDDFMAVAEKIHERPNLETVIDFTRDGKPMSLTVVPDEKSKKIGIAPAEPNIVRQKIGLLGAAKKSVWQCWNISYFTVYYLGQKIVAHERPDVAGPLGIGQVIVKAVKSGPEDFFYLIALISVAIGLFNLFPIPMLDGGHVLYYVIEGFRGRPLSMKVMGKANAVGMAFLLGLLVFATFNDIQRFRGPKQQVTEQTAAPTQAVTPSAETKK
jgi:regulator of sigma E protease